MEIIKWDTSYDREGRPRKLESHITVNFDKHDLLEDHVSIEDIYSRLNLDDKYSEYVTPELEGITVCRSVKNTGLTLHIDNRISGTNSTFQVLAKLTKHLNSKK